MLATKAIIANITYNGAVSFHIKSILPKIKQMTFEPKHGLSTWFAVRMNINAECFLRFLLFTLTLELTLTRKRRSSRPFSYFRVQLKQQHYSAKKRHPIKHGLSSCIIGKFSFFFLSHMHCRFTKQCYFNVVGHFICLVCHLRFLCDIITMSSISQVSRVLHAISKSGTA